MGAPLRHVLRREVHQVLLNLKCEKCGAEQKRMVATIQQRPACQDCGGPTIRVPLAPSIKVEETIDNGIMARRVTRLSRAEELVKNRQPKTPVH